MLIGYSDPDDGGDHVINDVLEPRGLLQRRFAGRNVRGQNKKAVAAATESRMIFPTPHTLIGAFGP